MRINLKERIPKTRGITSYQRWKEITYDLVTEEIEKRGLINEN